MLANRTDTVGELVAALNRRDYDHGLDRLAADFVYDLTRTESPVRGTHPKESMRRVIEEFLGPWESAEHEITGGAESGDLVVTPFRTLFRGRQGIELEARAVWVWEFRDEEVVRMTLFQDEAEAREFAGLEEA